MTDRDMTDRDMTDRAMAQEDAFARALLHGDDAVPETLIARDGHAPSRRFAVYRNNVYKSLIDLLASRFPVSVRIVGEEFFRAMARLFVEESPPSSAVLLRYGGEFADFVARFPPASSVPYLADVMRLEWAWHTAYHAPDAEPLSPQGLAGICADGVEHARLALHPSLQIVRSDYPVITIWELAGRDGEKEPAALPEDAEDALIVRPALEVEARRLPPGGAVFIQALGNGARLMDAAAQALEGDSAFDLEQNLAGLITSGAIAGAFPADP